MNIEDVHPFNDIIGGVTTFVRWKEIRSEQRQPTKPMRKAATRRSVYYGETIRLRAPASPDSSRKRLDLFAVVRVTLCLPARPSHGRGSDHIPFVERGSSRHTLYRTKIS